MNTALIRNAKYTRKQLQLLYRHNERLNTTYKNKNIHHEKTHLNFALKEVSSKSYLKLFDITKEKYNLKGQLKTTSNIVCEYIITAEEDFFKNMSYEEIQKYFKTAYSFVANYKNLGEQYILSAVVHMDEKTPHMHLVYIPVIHTIDSKGRNKDKICCSEFWKGKNSYKNLQNNFYAYMNIAGFEIERIKNNSNNKHIQTEELKKMTNFYVQEALKVSFEPEKELISDDLEIIRNDYKRIIKNYNEYAKKFLSIVTQKETIEYEVERLTKEFKNMEHKCFYWKRYAYWLLNYFSSRYKIPIRTLKQEIQQHIKQIKLQKQLNKQNIEKENINENEKEINDYER